MIIDNQSEEGVVFSNAINVSTLFDHKGNAFTLYNSGNGSTFNDYDGDGLKDNEDPAPTVYELCLLGHVWNDWSVSVPATCVLSGENTRICSVCEKTETEVIPATGDHSFSDGLCINCGEADPDYVAFIYGDVNGDGVINTKDVILLRKYIAAKNPITGECDVEISAGADANGDGVINTKDVILLRKYIAAKDPITGESNVVLGPVA